MSEAEEEDAIGGTSECKEIEILVGSSIPRDDNSYLPHLSDDIIHLILARLPCSKYCDLRLVNRQFRSLIKSRDLQEIRKKIGIKEPKVFFLSKRSGRYEYFCYEPYTRSCWNLPECPITAYHVSNSFCVGTHLFILGIIAGNINPSNIWRYELELNQWFNGPTMITSRCNCASADCGGVVCVAGGAHPFRKEIVGGIFQICREVLNSAEKYNRESNSWEPLSCMNRRRNFCSGFYMDSKFYVIGGRNENGDLLTCGECYDFEQNVWELIPNMIENDMIENDTGRILYRYEFTNFMVVVNNELYCFESISHRLKVYLKKKNTWKKVGSAPASFERNSAVALLSLGNGNELLLIGRKSGKSVVCFCTPSPDLDDVKWRVLDFKAQSRSLLNCCVMMV